jgi:hypothetical protein
LNMWLRKTLFDAFQLTHRAYLSAVVSFGMELLGLLGVLKWVQISSCWLYFYLLISSVCNRKNHHP